MRHRSGRLIVPLALSLASIVSIATTGAAAAAPPAKPAGATVGHYDSSRTCGACHAAIHKYWSESQHAKSASDPAFLAALQAAVTTSGDEQAVRQGCVWCHAPTTIVTGDLALSQSISREGITCDFCHTVKEVDLDRAGQPFTIETGPIKRGPLEYAKTSPAHQTAYSPLHRSSPLLCASCHEYKNALGVAILSTYSEWKEGPYPARGVPCQDCHMGLVPGTTVREGLQGQSQRVVNLHRVVGGSAMSQLARGLNLKIEWLTRDSGSAQISVVVANVAAGHAVPGGLSTKSLILAVGVETQAGTLEHRQERVYRREIKDADGRVLGSVADLFLKGASVGQDSRIKPGESRSERFNLPLPGDARAVVVRLEYRDASDPRGEAKTSLITEQRRDLTAR